MAFRISHRPAMPQLFAATCARALRATATGNGKLLLERQSAEVDVRTNDPGGGVAT